MILGSVLYFRQSRARHWSICCHHLSSAFCFGLWPPCFQAAIICSSTVAASPTILMSQCTVLLCEDGSISTWIFFEPGEKAFRRPVMRSSKRAPILIITSQIGRAHV